MNAKAKGARSERKVKKKLEAAFWSVVKAGGSLGLWDLVAVRRTGEVLLVQVKTNRMPSRQEMEKLQAFANEFVGVKCTVAVVRDRKAVEWHWLCPQKRDIHRAQEWAADTLPYEGPRIASESLVPRAFGIDVRDTDI